MSSMPLNRAFVSALIAGLVFGATACGDSQEGAEGLGHASAVLTAPPWEGDHAYSVGDLVSYGGKIYHCVQAHTAQEGWDPEHVPALWGFEVVDEPEDPNLPTEPPPEGISLDYLTLDADCDLNPASCCVVGSTQKQLTTGNDNYQSQAPSECILGLQGRDTVFAQSGGPSSLILGAGDDTAMDGPGDDLIWSGVGNDTINGWGGTNLFFAGWGDDTITAANGNNTVVPGPGIDGVALGTGDDTVHIFDLCEVGAGERIDGGTGHNVLYSPVPLDELAALGVQVVNFAEVIVKPEPCRSQCGDPAACDPCADHQSDTPAVEFLPHSLEEQRELVASFSWQDTKALPDDSQKLLDAAAAGKLNTDAEILAALPAMYYFEIYVNHVDHLREFDEIGIHWDLAPLFEGEWPEERAGQCDAGHVRLSFEGDPADKGGMFAYALMPAAIYNAIREAALGGEETYKAVLLREVPPEARAADGSVKLSYLDGKLQSYAPAAKHLTDEGETLYPPLVEDVETDGIVQKRFGRRLRKWARKVRDVVRPVVDGVRRGLGELAKKIRPTTKLTLNFTLQSHGSFSKLQRAWDQWGQIDSTFGKDLSLSGTRINVSQAGLLTLFKTKTNGEGVATVTVPKNRQTRVCVEADSPAARMEAGLLLPPRECFWRKLSKGDKQVENKYITEQEFHALAQIQDARVFARDVLGHKPDKATIQTGWVAKVIGWFNTGRPFAPCLERTNAPVRVINAAHDAMVTASLAIGVPEVVGVAISAAEAAEMVVTTDIVLMDYSLRRRAQPSHEYGHFVMCDLLHAKRAETFDLVWSQFMTAALLQKENEVNYLMEGFAEWFASQVTGGVDYFTFRGRDGIHAGDSTNGNFFFDPEGPAKGLGMEENVGGPMCSLSDVVPIKCQNTPSSDFDPIEEGMATVATLFHDIIDRNDALQGSGGGTANERTSDAAVWRLNGNNVFVLESPPFTWSHAHDEKIELPAKAFIDGIQDFAGRQGVFGTNLTEELFMSPVIEKMYGYGASKEDVCKLLALHRRDGTCPSWVPSEPPSDPIK